MHRFRRHRRRHEFYILMTPTDTFIVPGAALLKGASSFYIPERPDNVGYHNYETRVDFWRDYHEAWHLITKSSADTTTPEPPAQTRPHPASVHAPRRSRR